MASGIALPQPDLTEEEAIRSIRDFFREKPFVLFGTGMSCALDNRFGMGALRDELLQKIEDTTLNQEQYMQWGNVKNSLKNGRDLESALNEVADVSLIQMITSITGRFIALIDQEYAFHIASGEKEWPAIHFIKRLVETLPEGDRTLHVLTPNYDMLLEHACDYADVPYTMGFFGGIERKLNWQAVNQGLSFPEKIKSGRKFHTSYKLRKHIRLYKVHGSLSYFYHKNNVIENHAWMWNPPKFASRVMITPGLSKYEILQNYRKELQQSADAAIDKANRFLFLGYGFNDKHLEEYIKRKLINQGCKGLIITRDCNPRIQSILKEASNLWLLCKTDNSASDGTRIFNKQYSGWLEIPQKRLWDIREFSTTILGES